jgi:hypothetical protein
MLSISALFCDITRRRVVAVYGRVGTPGGSQLQGSRVSSSLKTGLIRCPETSVNSYTLPRNITEERRYNQHRGGSLKSRLNHVVDYRITVQLVANKTEERQ